jgi:peptidyl-prolyl cis-trans isomerase D
VVLPADRFLAGVASDDAGLAAWFEQHKADYRTPETANLQYVEISLDDLAQSVQVTEEGLRGYYEESVERYRVPERRRVRHILVTGDEAAAQAAYERAVAGEDFASLAQELSQDPGSAAQGGDLGWADRDTFVGPFADAAWSMQEGEIKGPVQTQFGWHVLKLEGIESSATPSFEEMRPQLEAEYRRTESEKLFGDLQEQLDTEAFEAGGDLQRVADSLALDIRSAEGFTRQGGALGNSPELIEAVFDPEVLNGSQLRTVEIAPGRVVALKVVAHQPPRDRPLEEVRDQVAAAYAVEQARMAAGQRAAALAEELSGGADWDTVAGQWIPKDVTDPSSARLRFIRRSEPAVPPAVSAAAFRAVEPEGKPVYGTAILASGDAAVWTVTYVRPGSPATLSPAQRAAALNEARDQARFRDAAAYLAKLRADAEVEVNPQLFQ